MIYIPAAMTPRSYGRLSSAAPTRKIMDDHSHSVAAAAAPGGVVIADQSSEAPMKPLTQAALPAAAAAAAIVLVVQEHQIHHRGGFSIKDCLVPRSPDSPPISSSSASSSIGCCDEDPENADENEVQSPLDAGGPLERMEALESSLPLKRGLSQYFDGKSRSFTSLHEVSSAQQLPKQENAFNLKRRRMLSQTRRAMIPVSKSSANFKLKKDNWSPPRGFITSHFLPRSFSLADVQRSQHHFISAMTID